MKPIPFKIPKTEDSSFRVQVDEGAHFYDRLHYHPEWQLTAIDRSRGVLFVGNSFTTFKEGDVFLIGSNVPHLMKNDAVYFGEESPEVYSVSLFFHENSFGNGFFDLPELKEVKRLLLSAQRGIGLKGEKARFIKAQIDECLHLKGIDLFQQLLGIMGGLTKCDELEYFSENATYQNFEEADGHRLNEVFQHSLKYLGEKIELAEVAEKANLSVSQFCRYFKLHTRKTYVQFLNELRIETACKLLQETDKTIAQICYETGFNNLSNFNRQFKKVKNLTPSRFRSNYLS